MRDIFRYKTPSGRIPFDEWISDISEASQARIDAYIQRVAMGAARKATKPVGNGVFEIKLDFGPGYRVYFGEIGRSMILLLIGGDKSSQSKDIERAKEFWRNYNAEN